LIAALKHAFGQWSGGGKHSLESMLTFDQRAVRLDAIDIL
jgi:hypothetical protein